MSPVDEVEHLLRDSVEALFERHCSTETVRSTAPGGWSPELWQTVTAAELPLVAVPEEHGGSGGSLAHWAIVIRAAARRAAPIPLAETGIAGWLLAEAGLTVPDGPLVAAAVVQSDGAYHAAGVPYARHAAVLVLTGLADDRRFLRLVPREGVAIATGTNMAGEPRDTIRISNPHGEPHWIAFELGAALEARCALARAIALAGALEATLAATLEHVRQRVQFGVPLAQMPLVRDRLALLAEESAAASAVCRAALDSGAGTLAVAAAKVRAGEAAGAGARLAHQLHGAIGTTAEHHLNLLTRRLWAWREEAGNERYWAARLGEWLATDGGEHMWQSLTAMEHAKEGDWHDIR